MTERFLYTRLTNLKHDYGVYVRPSKPVDPLIKVISSDFISSKRKLLFLYSDGEDVFFGVRERLSIEDERTRPILNFTGYRSISRRDVPFFSEVESHFEQITEDALNCHRLLDADPKCGSDLTSSSIHFSKGTPSEGCDWDQTIQNLTNGRSLPCLLMFSDTGKLLPIPERISPRLASEAPQSRTIPRGSTTKGEPVVIADSFDTAAVGPEQISPPPKVRGSNRSGDRYPPRPNQDFRLPEEAGTDDFGDLPPRKPNLPIDNFSDSIFNPSSFGSRVATSLREVGQGMRRLNPFSSKRNNDREP